MAAWYEQHGHTEYTATYGSVAAWQRERDLAARHGWTTRSRNPRPNKQGVIVIRYHRSASAEARARVEHAMAEVAAIGTALPAQERTLAEALRQVQTDLEAARTDETRDPFALEAQVLQSAQRLVNARQAMQAAHQSHLGALSRAEAAHAHARTVRGAKVDDLPGVDPSEVAGLAARSNWGDALLQAEGAFQDAQAALVSAVKEWQQAIAQRWDSSHRRAGLEEKVAARRVVLPELAQPMKASSGVQALVAEEDGVGVAPVAGDESEPERVTLLDRWRGWRSRRLEAQLADEGARLEQLEDLAEERQTRVIEAIRKRDSAAARADLNGEQASR